MPNYLYQCNQCEHQFEEFQTMSAEPLKKCPNCKKNKLERLITGGSGVVFKGSGFYQTDYKNTNKPNDATSTSGATKSSETAEPSSPKPASTECNKSSKD